MPQIAKYILLGISVLLLAGKKIFEKKPFVIKYSNLIRLFVFLPLIVILAFEFYKTRNIAFIIILVLGVAALGFVFYDMLRNDRENPNPPEN